MGIRIKDGSLAPAFGIFASKGAANALMKVTAILQKDYEIVKAWLTTESPVKKPVRAFVRECMPVLRQAANGYALITPENLILAAFLVEAGYARAENDYDGIRIWPTQSGHKLLIKNP
jgi:hypothetical protein